MRFDHGRFSAQSALHHVRIDGSLNQKIHGADLPGFLLKDPDKFFPDDLPFTLRLLHSFELFVKTLLGIDADKIQVIGAFRAEYLINFVSLVLPQQAMINKDTGQLIPHCFGHENGSHGGIHAAGEGAEYFSPAHFFPDGPDTGLYESVHLPGSRAAADVIDKVVEHLAAFPGVKDLRMKLDGI